MYVWTKKAEELARERRQAERKAGTEATWGGRPSGGGEARRWIQLGLVEWKDDKEVRRCIMKD